MRKRSVVLVSVIINLFALFLINCAVQKLGLREEAVTKLPTVEREFRAAWVATVANINWPGKPGLPVEKQKSEAIRLLDLLKDHNFNAVIFQVRPQCDALYRSTLEPWSYYLTGQQGKAPQPFYDPLQFWVEEAHKRGLELHAWLNPYRAHHPAGGDVTESSIVRKHPELVVKLKNGYYWLDPGMRGTQDHSYNVVMDLVKRYDIDGIHFDDYFYPYPSYNGNEDFPDSTSWRVYKNNGGKLSRNDWRRENVNKFIKRVYEGIKKEKPFVKFGLSPFGIWRPNHPHSIQGFDQYNQLYADARLWLNEGWIDYWTPQLYWPINQIPQSYPVLLGWWKDENEKNRHLWPGINIGRLKGEKAVDEVVNQIMVTRGMLPGESGNVHWSIAPLISNAGLADALLKGPYQNQALVPRSPWLDKRAPGSPQIQSSIKDQEIEIGWSHRKKKELTHWVVYSNYGGNWEYRILSASRQTVSLPIFTIKNKNMKRSLLTEETVRDQLAPLTQIRVSVVDRCGNESVPEPVTVPEFGVDQIPATGKIMSQLPPDFHLPFLEHAYEKSTFCAVPLKELKHKRVIEMLQQLKQQFPRSFFYEEIGRSVEQRPINLVRLGTGETKILLWSQMHGDEPTATAALFDVFNFLLKNETTPFVRNMLQNVTLLAVPMLNPDGAERFTRRNAQGLDVNRDARDLQSPEGRLLYQLQEKYHPDFGFNLHDQNARRTVGNTNKLVALSLMAPPFDYGESDNFVRLRAKKIVSVIQQALAPYIAGHISKYDAGYMPRSFGDSMQSWGVSTVLIESSGWYHNRDEFLKKMNFIALLSSFAAIADGSYQQADASLYDSLQENDKTIYDLLIRDVAVIDGTGSPAFRTDIAINYDSKNVGAIADMGDLDIFAAKDTIKGENLILTPGLVALIHDPKLTEHELIEKSEELLKRGFTTILFSVQDGQIRNLSALKKLPANAGAVYFLDKKLRTSSDSLRILRYLQNGFLGLIGNENSISKTTPDRFMNKPAVFLSELNQTLKLQSIDPQTIKSLTQAQTERWKIPGRGKIRNGRIADFILFKKDENGNPLVHTVFIKGHAVWRDGQMIKTKMRGERWF